jgi:hypothetical protein
MNNVLWLGIEPSRIAYAEDLGHDWDWHPYSNPMMVSKKVKQQRRSKNKLAKASRKRNRR